jgi:hypothetical protein
MALKELRQGLWARRVASNDATKRLSTSIGGAFANGPGAWFSRTPDAARMRLVCA